jgi:hypothetical protein
MVQTFNTGDDRLGLRTTVRRLGVYLDNFAIIDLSRGDARRRQRFLQSVENGADVMFSATSAMELLGPESTSTRDTIRNCLDAIGPYWFAVESPQVFAIVEREAEGMSRAEACSCDWFLKQFFDPRSLQQHGSQRLEHVQKNSLA